MRFHAKQITKNSQKTKIASSEITQKYIRKPMTLSDNLGYLAPILVHPVMRQIFADTVQLNCNLDLTSCHMHLFAERVFERKGPATNLVWNLLSFPLSHCTI